MSQFPDPIPLPEFIPAERQERVISLIRAASIGMVIRISIIALELAGVYFFHSSALLLDALATILDVVSTLLLIVFIKLAAKPPDRNHPFGHGRLEPFAGLQLALLLIVVGGWMFVQQTLQLFVNKSDQIIDSRTWIISLIALIFLEICYQVMSRVAKKQQSTALGVEALHFRIDAINSIFATIVLGLGAFMPHLSLFFDHAGALLISILMVGIGFFSSRDNLHQLMDRVPDKSFFDKVRSAAERVSGVLGTEKIRIQQYGPDAHVDIDIELDPHLSVETAHKISQLTRAEIQKEWPAVLDVTVHVEPYYANDH